MQHPFPYEVIYSDRKSLAIQITAQATVRVRAPKNCPAPTIDTFLYEKQAWILNANFPCFSYSNQKQEPKRPFFCRGSCNFIIISILKMQ